jgi:hypothetical protein
MENAMFSWLRRHSFEPTASPATDPAGVPILSSGSHRGPDQGACFMEYAAYLAGEPWSDRPACTHPLLAHLAREVNDRTSDAGRSALAPLVPTVIGLRDGDPSAYPRLVARVARTTIPEVSQRHQFVLAVALLRAQQLLPDAGARVAAAEVLDEIPLAASWATSFLQGRRAPSVPAYLKRAAPEAITACATAAAATPHGDPDALLRHLLEVAVDEFVIHRTPMRADHSTVRVRQVQET